MEFKALRANVDGAAARIAVLEAASASDDAASADALALSTQWAADAPKVARFKARADETDPDKRTYGATMTAQVRARTDCEAARHRHHTARRPRPPAARRSRSCTRASWS